MEDNRPEKYTMEHFHDSFNRFFKVQSLTGIPEETLNMVNTLCLAAFSFGVNYGWANSLKDWHESEENRKLLNK